METGTITKNCESGSVNTSTQKSKSCTSRTSVKETSPITPCATESGVTLLDKCRKNILMQRNGTRGLRHFDKDSLKHTTTKKDEQSKQDSMHSKTRRSWELWSVEDKNSFFEALCEYGKDFESIQSYIAQKSKKKGMAANMIKNKDQVRHFYYRTWHKISKHLKNCDGVRKQTQEIYGLVNYAEMRKKIGGCLNEKSGQKLNELVFSGVTTVKCKGKKLRIKTPVCRALKKLNNVEEPKQVETKKLPKDISLELRPFSNKAWFHVQDMSQNPRVQIKVSPQVRLKAIIEYMQQKWKSPDVKKKEKIINGLVNSDGIQNQCMCLLRLKPNCDASVTGISILPVDSASSSDVCLEKHIKISQGKSSNTDGVKMKKSRMKTKNYDGDVKSRVTPNSLCRTIEASEGFNKATKKTVTDDSDKIDVLSPPKSLKAFKSTENAFDKVGKSVPLLTSLLDSSDQLEEEKDASVDEENMASSEKIPTDDNPQNFTLLRPSVFDMIEKICSSSCENGNAINLGQLLSSSCLDNNLVMEDKEAENCKVTSMEDSPKTNPEAMCSSASEADTCDHEKNVMENIKNGWTVNNAGLLTIGELYLMLGYPTKIMLEYEFEEVMETTEMNANNLQSKPVVSGHRLSSADVMEKLISVAALTFPEFKSKQVSPLSPTPSIQELVNFSCCSGTCKTSCCVGRATNLKASNSTNNPPVEIIKPFATDAPSPSFHRIASPLENQDVIVPNEVNPTMIRPLQELLKKEIDKLLPGTRRGCRIRRKPLVVQRPLTPRDGVKTVPSTRPMTVVQLVPSGPQLIQPNISSTDDVSAMLTK